MGAWFGERDEAREAGGTERRRCVARVCASVFRRREGAHSGGAVAIGEAIA
jgi:hypothetical protein